MQTQFLKIRSFRIWNFCLVKCAATLLDTGSRAATIFICLGFMTSINQVHFVYCNWLSLTHLRPPSLWFHHDSCQQRAECKHSQG
jgi:hypothetical protein